MGYAIGARIRTARTIRGMSQQALADASDCSLSTIRGLESGRRDSTSLQLAARLASSLEVSLEYLAGLTDHMGERAAS